MRLFLTKLQEKQQTPEQQQQAAHAVALYFELSRAQEKVPEIIGDGSLPRQRERLPPTAPRPARGGTSADSLRGKGAPVVLGEWETIAQRLAEEIKTRHYSPKTLKA
jgi:integron integrase